AMQDQCRLSRRIAERPVMQAQLGHDFAGVKAEVARDPVALFRCRIVCGRSHCGCERERKRSCYADAGRIHLLPPWMRRPFDPTNSAFTCRNGLLSDVLLCKPARV